MAYRADQKIAITEAELMLRDLDRNRGDDWEQVHRLADHVLLKLLDKMGAMQGVIAQYMAASRAPVELDVIKQYQNASNKEADR